MGVSEAAVVDAGFSDLSFSGSVRYRTQYKASLDNTDRLRRAKPFTSGDSSSREADIVFLLYVMESRAFAEIAVVGNVVIVGMLLSDLNILD
jgi:hypothetical protein